MADDPIVNEELASVEETVSAEAEVTEQPEEQPLTKGDVARMIAEQTEVAKREIQSAKDKATAEVVAAQRRARLAEDSLTRVRGKFGELDPEARQVLEIEDLRAENLAFRQREQREAVERQQGEYTQALNQALIDSLSDLGVDPKDERIDWAHDATSLPVGLSRFNKSIAKIAKEDGKAVEQKAKQDATDKLAQERKEAGLDSGDTGILPGASKRTFTKAQIGNREFWEKNKDDILKAQEENRITD